MTSTDDLQLAPILHLVEHEIRGERRWTGRAELSGVIRQEVLILRVGGVLIAVRNRCPHHGVPLLLGRLDEAAGILECPSHGWALKLGGGELRGRPVVERDGGFFLVLSGRVSEPC